MSKIKTETAEEFKALFKAGAIYQRQFDHIIDTMFEGFDESEELRNEIEERAETEQMKNYIKYAIGNLNINLDEKEPMQLHNVAATKTLLIKALKAIK